jgi:hypothetical protein
MSEPRNVTSGDEFRERYMNEREEAPEWRAWTWASGGRGFPWLGVLLVLVGIGVLIQQIFPGVSVGSLVLLAIGAAFLAGWIFAGSWFAMIPGVLLIALAVGRLVEELGVYTGPGITAIALAIGFLIVWLLGQTRQRHHTWALWGAGIFGVIGLVQAAGTITGIPELGSLWPVLIIVIGVLLLINARRG